MTTISREAFDRSGLIEAIKLSTSSLEVLLAETEEVHLRTDILKSSKKHLKQLIKEIDQKINLNDLLPRV